MAGEFSADLAVVIGIDAYDAAVGRLETPVGDARAIARLLESRFGYEVILRCDGEATRESLRALLHEELPRRIHEESRLLFYFAGHGVAHDSTELAGPQGFLVPQDAGPTVDTHLPMDEVREALASLPCRHLLVVLDCCFAGSFHWAGMRPLYVPDELLYEERYRHWVRHRARWALASSAHDEYALDRPNRRRGQTGCHSPFATALLEGIAGAADRYPEGGDGIVTLAELYAYVRERLAPHQSPLLAPLKGQTRGEYVFRDPRQPLALRSAEAEVLLDEGANPYRGLEPYRTEDDELFFGRGDAARRLLHHVRQHPLTVVAGPSGSGKSSLVQAGLLSRLRARHHQRGGRTFGWVVAPLPRMAADPLAVLREGLAAAGAPPLPDAASLNDGAVTAWAADWAKLHPCQRLLVVVDQAEELITRVARSGSEASGAIPEGATRFLSCLEALLGTGRIHALLVVRSDYEPDLDDGPLASRWSAGRFVVPPLSRGDLRQIVEGPAVRKALYFDDPRLGDRLVDEVVGMPGGLPLLSYALSRLYLAYLKAGRGDRLLTADDLKAIGGEAAGGEGPVAPGGIVRILREGADGAVTALPDDLHRETLWRVLLRMVSLTGARATRRQVPMRELDYPGEAENPRVGVVLTQLTDKARLLVRDLGAGDGVVEPAHDELLVAWPALVRKIDEARVRLPIHRRLGEAATEWDTGAGRALGERRRTHGLDLRLLGLVEASGLPDAWLNRVEAEYLAAARQERRQQQRRQRLVLAAILLLTIGTAFFLYSFIQQRKRAIVEQSESLAHSAEAASRQQDFAAAGLLAVESLKLGKTDAALQSLALSKAWSWPLVTLLRGHTGPLSGISYSPDGNWLATTAYFGDNNVVRIWNTRSLKPGPILTHANRVYRASFHPLQQRVAVPDYSNKVWIWDFGDNGTHVACSLQHEDVRSSVFEIQGRFVITYSSKTAEVWDLNECSEAKILSAPLAKLENNTSPEINPIALPSTFITTEREAALLWRIDSNRPVLFKRLEHPGGVTWVDISADGEKALTSGEDGTARVWDLQGSGIQPKQVLRHDKRINSGRFSRDGRLVVTASADGTAKIWEVSANEEFKLKSVLAHGAEVKSAIFDPSGRWVASWSYPREDAPGSVESDILWIWDVESGLRTAALLSSVVGIDFSPDGKFLAVAGFDNTARIWRVDPARTEIPRDGLIGDDAEKTAIGVDRMGRLFLADLYKEQVRTWNLPEARERLLPLQLSGQIVPGLFISPDGSQIVASDGRTTTQWDSTTGEPVSPTRERAPFPPRLRPRNGNQFLAHEDYSRSKKDPRLWDLQNGEPLKVKSLLSEISETLVSENGAYAALAGADRFPGRDQIVELWDVKNKTLEASFQERIKLDAVDPQGRSIAGQEGGPSNRLTVLVLGERRPRVLSQDGWVMSARYSPNGSHLVTASRDGTAWIWNTKLWQHQGTLTHGAWVTFATYDPKGEVIATTATDGSTKIWSASTYELLAVLQHHQPQRICLFSPDSSVLVSLSAAKATVWHWRKEIINPEEERLALRFGAARQLKGLASERESWLKLPAGLPEPGSRVAVKKAAQKLLANTPSHATINLAADAVLGDPDPALAWIHLFRALADHPRSNGYRLLVLEELEARAKPSTLVRDDAFKLILAATRAEGAEEPENNEGTADRLREDIRHSALRMLKKGYRHPIIEALATESGAQAKQP